MPGLLEGHSSLRNLGPPSCPDYQEVHPAVGLTVLDPLQGHSNSVPFMTLITAAREAALALNCPVTGKVFLASGHNHTESTREKNITV
ncbi:hypothetical protein AVEN_124344-1 [Araneus ventricosus]|uniref:Uncharacterized protein n=1 Tax=Araneus ventricosus TaxID=182803 RepID=A0A4Y2S7E5_ARAVE|nr:hypothetical protein AVEN_124344-1 [Araneus ventricosus]